MSELLKFILAHEEQFRRQRLPSLYSDFRPLRATNPDGYTANVSAWQAALTRAARAGVAQRSTTANDLLVLDAGPALLDALETSEWGRPQALGAVFGEATARGEMVPLTRFLASGESVLGKPSVVLAPLRLFVWSLRQLGIAGESGVDGKLVGGKLVVMANVEAASKNVLARISGLGSSTVDRIFSKEGFTSTFSSCISNNTTPPSKTDIDVLLKYLARDKKQIAYDGEARLLFSTIKFPTLTSPSLSITQHDTSIASLNLLITSLTSQTAALNTRITALTNHARSAITQHNRSSALAALRAKTLAEATLTQRSATLVQLESVAAQISQAADQVQVLRVLRASTGVLQGLNRQASALNVEETVAELREEMEAVKEMGGVLNEVGREGVDEASIEEELRLLEEQEGNVAVGKMPSVPTREVGVSKTELQSRPEKNKETQAEAVLDAAVEKLALVN
ncbi:MAG: hypothetical protein M1829_003533 [Trizodia sp. TS-e1964]|nr:MAG: hypothetical protein M1829_003533 [Trizodia sp. TS-e1964]